LPLRGPFLLFVGDSLNSTDQATVDVVEGRRQIAGGGVHYGHQHGDQFQTSRKLGERFYLAGGIHRIGDQTALLPLAQVVSLEKSRSILATSFESFGEIATAVGPVRYVATSGADICSKAIRAKLFLTNLKLGGFSAQLFSKVGDLLNRQPTIIGKNKIRRRTKGLF